MSKDTSEIARDLPPEFGNDAINERMKANEDAQALIDSLGGVAGIHKLQSRVQELETLLERSAAQTKEILEEMGPAINRACQPLQERVSELEGTVKLMQAVIGTGNIALSFYANENNYNDDPSDIPGSAPIWVDHGGRAQSVLAGTAGNDMIDQLTAKDTEIAQLKEQVAAQLDELTQISSALGTDEGHSSVDHIIQLKAQVATMRECLKGFAVGVAFVTSMRPGSEDAFAEPIRQYDALRKATTAGNELLQEMQQLRADKERLDWLEKKFALWHQGSVLSKMDDSWFCNSGFHEGSTARQSIDAARAQQTEGEKGKQ